MTMTPIEDVIAAAEQQAEIDWELEHRPPEPCRHERTLTRKRMCSNEERTTCADCGREMP